MLIIVLFWCLKIVNLGVRKMANRFWKQEKTLKYMYHASLERWIYVDCSSFLILKIEPPSKDILIIMCSKITPHENLRISLNTWHAIDQRVVKTCKSCNKHQIWHEWSLGYGKQEMKDGSTQIWLATHFLRGSIYTPTPFLWKYSKLQNILVSYIKLKVFKRGIMW